MLVQLYYLRVPLFARPVIDVTAGLAFFPFGNPKSVEDKEGKKK